MTDKELTSGIDMFNSKEDKTTVLYNSVVLKDLRYNLIINNSYDNDEDIDELFDEEISKERESLNSIFKTPQSFVEYLNSIDRYTFYAFPEILEKLTKDEFILFINKVQYADTLLDLDGYFDEGALPLLWEEVLELKLPDVKFMNYRNGYDLVKMCHKDINHWAYIVASYDDSKFRGKIHVDHEYIQCVKDILTRCPLDLVFVEFLRDTELLKYMSNVLKNRLKESELEKDMKYYAVRKGHTIGIFTNWEECSQSVNGFKGAEYKSFKTKNEAEDFLNKETSVIQKQGEKVVLEDGRIYFFVDGSYNSKEDIVGYGLIAYLNGDKIFQDLGSYRVKEYCKLRNVSGEIRGAMKAVELCLANKWRSCVIAYDYAGIEKWATGDWKAENPVTQEYVKFMMDAQKHTKVNFLKISAHSDIENGGHPLNDIADLLAKKAVGL